EQRAPLAHRVPDLGALELLLAVARHGSLGAQTAEVLNLIDRLRERGLGVIMVSHNMADVQAVADTVAVLRLGRNNGVYDALRATAAELVAAITGAEDNVVTRRTGRHRTGRSAPTTADGEAAS
ncbi:ATP-binding cassette domain-containing protein, partial [Streptomyces sp. NPDC003860]